MSKQNILMESDNGQPAHQVFFGFDGFNVYDRDGLMLILHVSATLEQMREVRDRISSVIDKRIGPDSTTDDAWEMELS